MEAAAQGFLAWLFYCFRPVIKGFLRVTTRLCELQRVCYGERAGAPRTMAVGELHIGSAISLIRFEKFVFTK